MHHQQWQEQNMDYSVWRVWWSDNNGCINFKIAAALQTITSLLNISCILELVFLDYISGPKTHFLKILAEVIS